MAAKYYIHVGLEDIAIRDAQDNDVCVCWDESFATTLCDLLNLQSQVICNFVNSVRGKENTNEQSN